MAACLPTIVAGFAGSAPDAGRFRTFFFFATDLAAGIALVLPFIPLAQIGRRFFILMSFTAIVFSALGLGSSGLDTGYLHMALAAILVLYNVIVPPQAGVDRSARRESMEGGSRPALSAFATGLLVLAAGCGGAAVVLDALHYPVDLGFSGPQAPWLAASFLSSAILLGSAATAMVLGHWYLVVRKLSFTPLARVTRILMLALALRIVVACGAAWAQGTRWESMLSSSGWTGFFLGDGIFILARTVFGLLAPAALAWMTWKCVQIRSNQSATGILYVILAFILIGEIIAKYFLLSERLVI